MMMMQDRLFHESAWRRRPIDRTPGDGWRSAARATAAAALLAIALPLVWLLGALLALALLGAAGVLLVGAVVRSKLHGHRVAGSSDDIIDMR